MLRLTRKTFAKPPVHHLHLAVGAQHHVGGLEVAVDHSLGMGIGHRLAYLEKELHAAGQGVLPGGLCIAPA